MGPHGKILQQVCLLVLNVTIDKILLSSIRLKLVTAKYGKFLASKKLK